MEPGGWEKTGLGSGELLPGSRNTSNPRAFPSPAAEEAGGICPADHDRSMPLFPLRTGVVTVVILFPFHFCVLAWERGGQHLFSSKVSTPSGVTSPVDAISLA